MTLQMSDEYNFAVVKFEEDEEHSTSEVPISWVSTDMQFCWWPPTKNVTNFIIRSHPPNTKTWKKYPVSVESLCKTLVSARKRAEDENYNSNAEGDITYRRKRKPKHFIDFDNNDDSSEENLSVKRFRLSPPPVLRSMEGNGVIPPAPHVEVHQEIISPPIIIGITDEQVTSHATQGTTDTDERASLAVTSHATQGTTDTDERASLASTVTLNASLSGISDSSAILSIILDTVTEVKLQVSDLSKKLATLQGRNRDLTEKESNLSVTKRLPISSIENLQEFEKFLSDELNKNMFENFINVIGGNSPKDHIVRSLSRTYADSFAIDCSWQGQRKNFKVCTLKSMNAIKDVIVSNHLLRENEFEAIAAEWFRHAKQRLLRKQNKGSN